MQTRRRWIRFSLQTLLVAVTLFAVWLGWQVYSANQVRRAIAKVEQFGGRALLSFEYSEQCEWAEGHVSTWAPKWMRDALGREYFGHITEITFVEEAIDGNDLRDLLQICPDIERLNLHNVPITDGDLSYLDDLCHLRELDLENTKVTEAGMESLRATKPKLTIY